MRIAHTVTNIVIYGLAIASFVGLLTPFFRINLKGNMGWWFIFVLPMSVLLACGLERLGIFQCLEKLLSN